MKNMKRMENMKKTDLVKNMTAQVSITGLSSRDARVEQGGLEPWQITTLSSSYSRSFLVDILGDCYLCSTLSNLIAF